MLISEKFTLTALHDEKGSIIFAASTSFPYALAGAALMDLFFEDKIIIKDKIVILKDNILTGNPVLDTVMEFLIDSKKDKRLKHWVSKIGMRSKNLKNAVLQSLMVRDILYKEKKKILFFIPVSRYKTKNPSPELDMKSRLKNIVLFGQKASEKDIVLLSLTAASDLLGEIFTKEEKKIAKRFLKNINSESEIGKTVSAVVQEMQTAVMAAVTASAAASASSGS